MMALEPHVSALGRAASSYSLTVNRADRTRAAHRRDYDRRRRSRQRRTHQPMADTNLSSFIWSVADLLRRDYKQSDYGKVILPFTVLRRLDCVLEPTKAAVLAEAAKRQKTGVNPEAFLKRKSGQGFYNTSPLDLKTLMGDQDHIGENLRAYIQAFSPAVRDIFEKFDFHAQIDRRSTCTPTPSATPTWGWCSRN
jgi:type I restriction-modification system DNA methylase subunit